MEEQIVLTVSRLTAGIQGLLETAFPDVWVSGEISDLARPRSGHVYFSLKDDAAQIRGVVWRSAAAALRFELEDGQEVVCNGGLDVYAPRGTYQLIVRRIEPLGLGVLEAALRKLQEKLAKEGLFDARHKKPLPETITRIAVITSPTGAAIRDFLQVLTRRGGGVDVLIVPTLVQGEGAALQMARGIAMVNMLADPPDCIVLTRGGGSMEDLWAFNEEPLVRAVFASRIPVVSAVGHEIDVTLSDLAADVRAATPSEAAELTVASADESLAAMGHLRDRLRGAIRGRLESAKARLENLAAHRVFRRPEERIRDATQRLDEFDSRASRGIRRILNRHAREWELMGARLDSLSPLNVLRRGYSLTTRRVDGRLVRRAQDVRIGEQVSTRLANGEIVSSVDEVFPEPS